jgi:hypothetical protein
MDPMMPRAWYHHLPKYKYKYPSTQVSNIYHLRNKQSKMYADCSATFIQVLWWPTFIGDIRILSYSLDCSDSLSSLSFFSPSPSPLSLFEDSLLPESLGSSSSLGPSSKSEGVDAPSSELSSLSLLVSPELSADSSFPLLLSFDSSDSESGEVVVVDSVSSSALLLLSLSSPSLLSSPLMPEVGVYLD